MLRVYWSTNHYVSIMLLFIKCEVVRIHIDSLSVSTQLKFIVWDIVEELTKEVLLDLFGLTLDLCHHVLFVYGVEFFGKVIPECSDNGLSQHSLSQLMDHVYLVRAVLRLRTDWCDRINELDFLRRLLLLNLLGSS